MIVFLDTAFLAIVFLAIVFLAIVFLAAGSCLLLAAISVSQSLVLAAGLARPLAALGRVLGLRPSTARFGRLAVGEERQERRAAEERLERIGVRGSLRGEASFLGEERRLEGD